MPTANNPIGECTTQKSYFVKLSKNVNIYKADAICCYTPIALKWDKTLQIEKSFRPLKENIASSKAAKHSLYITVN